MSRKTKYWDINTPNFQMEHFIDSITGTKTQNELEKISKTNMTLHQEKLLIHKNLNLKKCGGSGDSLYNHLQKI